MHFICQFNLLAGLWFGINVASRWHYPFQFNAPMELSLIFLVEKVNSFIIAIHGPSYLLRPKYTCTKSTFVG